MTSDSGAAGSVGSEDPLPALRPLVVGQAISSIGDGLWITVGIIYLTGFGQFATTTVGFTVAAASIPGIVLTYAAGMISDRIGARRVLVALTAIRGVAAAAICVADTVPLLFAACMGLYGALGASNGVRAALVCGIAPSEQRMTMLARIRVAQHIAYAAGAGLGAVVLAIGRREVFLAAFVANAVTFAVLAVLTLRVPQPTISSPIAHRSALRSTAVRDYSYQLVMFVTALFALGWAMLTTGFPLWIRDRTSAPTWTAGAAIFLSCLAISVFQLRVTHHLTSARTDRSALTAGVALAGSCVMLASAAWASTPYATALILVAILLHILGELFFVAVWWRLSVDLMDHRYVGIYQGAAASGVSTMLAVGPAVLALVVTTPGVIGWMMLAGLFLATGLITPVLHRYAASRRPSDTGLGI